MATSEERLRALPEERARAPQRGASLEGFEHEQLVVRRGTRSSLAIAIAVHSTRLGPALGGCRMWRYPALGEAVRDVLRLSRAMTLKAAAAGIPLGGGKGVVSLAGPAPEGEQRRRILLDFADAVESLGGAYITAEDVGTGAEDMVTVAERTAHVTGLPHERGGSGDPSPYTAMGVEAAMRACARSVFGSSDLTGRSVAVVGCGRVGAKLARRLAGAGASLVLSDVDPAKRSLAVSLPGASWIDSERALLAEVDVLAPCALGGAIDESNAGELRCRVVCGSANNQLAHDGLAQTLAGRGILYAPDFIANAGGLINVATELDGYDPERARTRVAAIEAVMARILRRAEAAGATPLEAAVAMARERLAGAGGAT